MNLVIMTDLMKDYNFKTIIQNTEISWSFYDTKGNYYSWVMPVSTYEDLLRRIVTNYQNTIRMLDPNH